jgi:hypothetical protein
MAYKPPRQSGIGQVIDSMLILVVLVICLLVPFRWDDIVASFAPAPAPAAGTGAATTEAAKEPEPTWESLKQTPVQAQQWEKLGKKPADAKPLIDAKFDFDADLHSWKLPLTIIVIVAYFIFLLRTSDREYRQVIDERFGKSK